MNRCAQVIADRCTKTLAEYVNNRQSSHIDNLTFNSSLKYSIVNDPGLLVEISGKSRFEVFESSHGIVVPNGPIISEARLSDFFLGSTRVMNQHRTVLGMRHSGATPAWILVSAYYCAYFACIELSKVSGRIMMSLEEDEISSLRFKAAGPFHAEFFQGGHTNFIGTEFGGKLVFNAVGSKPHAAAWTNALYVLRDIFGDKGWADADQYIKFLSDPDYSPSRIRNTWNYRRSDYFGRIGEKHASEFMRLIGNPSGVNGWLARQGSRTETLDPCIVAALCETLSFGVIDAETRVRKLVAKQ